MLTKQKLKKHNHEELRKLANKYKLKRKKKEYIISEILQINHPFV